MRQTLQMFFLVMIFVRFVVPGLCFEHVAEFYYPPPSTQKLRVYSTDRHSNFIHDPAFVPSATCGSNSSKIVCCDRNPSGGATCRLVVLLTSPTIRQLAFESVTSANREVHDSMKLSDIAVRPIVAVAIDGAKIVDFFGYAYLMEAYIPIRDGQEQFTINFYLPSVADIPRFEEDIWLAVISYQVLADGYDSVTKESQVIRWEDLRATELYAVLSSMPYALDGGRTVYIHRDDLKEHIHMAAHTLASTFNIAKPAAFYKNFESTVSNLFPMVETNGFTAAMWEATYNSADLSHTNMNEYLWEKLDSTERSYLDIPNHFGVELKFSFSGTEARHFCRKHDVDLKIKWSSWYLNRLNVRRVDLSKFSSSDQIFAVNTFTVPSRVWASGFLEVRTALFERATRSMEALWKSDQLVLMWSGAASTIPDGWVTCDSEYGLHLCGKLAEASVPGVDPAESPTEQPAAQDQCDSESCAPGEREVQGVPANSSVHFICKRGD